MFLETGSVLRKKPVDDRQKDQLKILKRVNKESLQRLTQETNLLFGTVDCTKNGNCQNKIDRFFQFFHSVKRCETFLREIG
jgi:ABC-type branched-subunit amino acid transport system ATPase component